MENIKSNECDNQCLICLNSESRFILSVGGCNHSFCVICGLESIRKNMICPLDRQIIKQLSIFSINEDNQSQENHESNVKKEIVVIKSDEGSNKLSFNTVVEKVLKIENMEDKEYIEELFEIDPYLLCIGPFIKNKGQVTKEMVHDSFSQYGPIEDIIVFENSAYILYANSNHGFRAKHGENKLFHGESITRGCFESDLWDDLLLMEHKIQ